MGWRVARPGSAAVIVAVDPSVRSPGVAVIERGELVGAARLPFSAKIDERGERARQVAALIAAWVRPRTLGGGVSLVVYEWPQIYRASKSKGDPNDLIALAAVGAGVAAFLAADEIRTPTPHEWIGNLPKATKGDPWKSPRAMRIASRLSPAERARVPDSHDAIDAVGLALWAAGRLTARRVLPGAT